MQIAADTPNDSTHRIQATITITTTAFVSFHIASSTTKYSSSKDTIDPYNIVADHYIDNPTMRSDVPPPSSTNRLPFKLNRPNNNANNEPIAVIIGKKFESTTLPDGSQQINEVTKYKRLNDGYVYTESKLRSTSSEEGDKENAAVNVNPDSNNLRGKSSKSNDCEGFKLAPLKLACPSSLTLASSSSVSSDNSHDPTSNGKGIFHCQTKDTMQMSVVTEDYEEDSMVEEYLYEKEERKALSPYAAAHKENYLGGWCPSFDDIENNSLQLFHSSNVWSSSGFGDNALMSVFDRGNGNRKNREQVHGEEEGSNDRFSSKVSKELTCRKKLGTRKCMIIICFLVFVAVAIGVVTIAFQPSNESGWDINKEAHNDPNCIRLEIIIDTDSNTVDESNPDGDMNEWSLVRHGKEDKLISIAKSSELSPDTKHNFWHCVQPGVFTFTLSDSGGDGLGTNGEGGYYIVADGVRLGVSSFFFHEDEMTFTLPFEGDEYDGDGDTECADDFFLVMKTDTNPGETTWEVVDNDTGELVLEGGPYELSNSVYTKRACMKDGNYTLNMKDGGNDGVCCEKGYGLYMLYNDGELIVSSDGNYGSGASTTFLLGNDE